MQCESDMHAAALWSDEQTLDSPTATPDATAWSTPPRRLENYDFNRFPILTGHGYVVRIIDSCASEQETTVATLAKAVVIDSSGHRYRVRANQQNTFDCV